MRFVGGQISHNQGMQVRTPVATLGVRGGVVTVVYPLPAESRVERSEHRGLPRPARDRPCRRDRFAQRRRPGDRAAGLCRVRELGERADPGAVPDFRRAAAAGHGLPDERARADRRRGQSSDRSDDRAAGSRRHDRQRSDAPAGQRSAQQHVDLRRRRRADPQSVADQPDAEHHRSATPTAASGSAGCCVTATAASWSVTAAPAAAATATTSTTTASTAALWRWQLLRIG